ncbi:MAG: M28 family peptidase [Paludibacteraceae bacterium]|nr:M28 family peptidase [Paludibacteraceae bacterium]
MKKQLMTLLAFAVALCSFAQDDLYYPDSLAPEKPSEEWDYAREVTQNLCSNAMAGRGYGKAGNKLAADYIVNEFQSMGVEAVGGQYRQPFTVKTNAFSGAMTVQLNNDYLMPGEDFQIEPSSPGVSGNFTATIINRQQLSNAMTRLDKLRQARGNVIIVDNTTRYSGETYTEATKINELIEQFKTDVNTQVKAVIIYDTTRNDRWNISTKQGLRPVIYLKKPVDDIESITNVKLDIDAQLMEQTTYNVVGVIRGMAVPDSFVVVCCHYDHLGTMGGTPYPGANNGASGVAMMLSLAKHFQMIKPAYSMLFIAFSGNEVGYKGVRTFLRYPAIELDKIKYVFSFDLMGNGSKGIKIVNGAQHPEVVAPIQKIAKQYKFVPDVEAKKDAKMNEHWFFKDKGIEKSFFIYSVGGFYNYHNLKDNPDLLPYTRFAEMNSLFIRYLETIKFKAPVVPVKGPAQGANAPKGPAQGATVPKGPAQGAKVAN